MIKRFFFLAALALTAVNAAARTITPADVVRLTRESGLVGQSLRLAPDLAAHDVTIARSQYDLNLTGEFSHTEDMSERVSTIFGTESTETKLSLGASQLTPAGSTITLGFQNTRQTSNSPFVTANPVYDSRVVLGVTQPILKNYFGFTTRHNVASALKKHELARAEMRSKMQDLVYQNLALYWNWYLQYHTLRLNSEALNLARRTLGTNREKLNRGLLERVDLYAFEANFNLQESLLLTAKDQVEKLAGDLRYALSLDEDSLSPAAGPKPAPVQSVEDAVARALASNPVLEVIRADLAANDISIAIQKNAKLPQLDLVGSLTLNGVDQNYDVATGDIGDGNPIWVGGVNFSFPLQNRAASAGLKKLQIAKKQKLLSFQDAENKIVALVRASHNRYRANLKRLAATSNMVRNQRLKWEGEVTRYDQGRSSPDTVIRFQDEYLNARKQELQARVAVEMARLDLNYALGSLSE